MYPMYRETHYTNMKQQRPNEPRIGDFMTEHQVSDSGEMKAGRWQKGRRDDDKNKN